MLAVCSLPMTDNFLLKISGDISVMTVDEQLIEKKLSADFTSVFARLHDCISDTRIYVSITFM